MSKSIELVFSKQNKINQLPSAGKETGYLLGLKYETDTLEKIFILSIIKAKVTG
jgi:hypothetical protein